MEQTKHKNISTYIQNFKREQDSKVIILILLGFLLIGLKDFAAIIYHPLQHLFALPGLMLIFLSPVYYQIKLTNPFNGYIKYVFYIFLIWVLFIIIRPLSGGTFLTEKSYHPYSTFGINSYLLVMIILLGVKTISINTLFRFTVIFSFIGLVYFILNYNNMITVMASGVIMGFEGEVGVNNLANNYYFWFAVSSFSLLCIEFVPQKSKWIIVFSNIFMLIILMIFARRGGVFMYFLYFIGSIYLYILKLSNKKSTAKVIIFTVLTIGALIVMYRFSDKLFPLLYERLNEDTRSNVDTTLINHLTQENLWFFGGGIDAVYNHIGFDEPRYNHETGYLYLILKGGIIYLSLYVFLLLHAFYMGFFKTRNRFTKGVALYLLFHVIFLVPFGLPSFSLEYLFVWIGFAICEHSKWRKMSNQQMHYYLSNPVKPK